MLVYVGLSVVADNCSFQVMLFAESDPQVNVNWVLDDAGFLAA